jgi:hypothetical protein
LLYFWIQNILKDWNFCIVDDDDIYQFTITFAEKTDLVNKIIVFSNGLKALIYEMDKGKHSWRLFLDMQTSYGWSFGGIPTYQAST